MNHPCADCPFKKSSPLRGSFEWLRNIMERGEKDPFFAHSCHNTDPKADGYNGAKWKRQCSGHNIMIMNECDKTPGKGEVYESRHQLIETYLRHHLGNEEFENMRRKAT